MDKSNYFSWHTDDFELEILGSTGSNPLLSYHINPYVRTVSVKLNDSICHENYCYARYSDESCVLLNNGFRLYSKQNGWQIINPEGQMIPDKLRAKYNINEQNIFSEVNGKDRIEIAIEFCEDLLL